MLKPTGQAIPYHIRTVTGTYWGKPIDPIYTEAAGYPRKAFWRKPDANISNPPDITGYRYPSPWSGNDESIAVTAPFSGTKKDFFGATTRTISEEGSAVVSGLTSLPDVGFNAIQEARMKTLNNISDEILDVSMVLAEMQSTVTTATSLLHRLGRSMEAVYKRKPTHYMKLMHGRNPPNLKGRHLDTFNREVAGTYLEWKYGIMPSIYDLQGACAGLDINEKGSLWDNPPLLVARSKVSRTESHKTLFSLETPNSNTTVWLEGEVKHEIRTRCDYRISADGIRGLNRYGLGLTSVATVLWDKKPFSFVLDMAMPMSQLIKAWGALAGVSPISYVETYHSVMKTKPVYKDFSAQGVPCTAKIPSVKWRSFNRKVYDRPPYPLPFVRNPIKSGNMATVLALFTQLRNPRGIK